MSSPVPIGVVPLTSPLYQIPLHDNELIVVGRICVMWGHIDAAIDSILPHLYSAQKVKELRKCTIGKWLKELRQYAKTDKDTKRKAVLDAMCMDLGSAMEDRNVLVHGRWGWEFKPKTNAWHRMAYSDERPQQPFYVTKLVDLHERVCVAGVSVDRAWYHIVQGCEPPPGTNRFWIQGPKGLRPDDIPYWPPRQEFAR